MLESIAQTMTNKPNLKLDFKQATWAQTLNGQMKVYPNFAMPITSIGNIAIFYFEIFLIFQLAMFKMQSYTSLLMRGATRQSIVLSRTLIYFFISVIICEAYIFANWIYGVDVSGWHTIGWIFILAYTMYISAFASLTLLAWKYLIVHFVIGIMTELMLSFTANFTTKIN